MRGPAPPRADGAWELGLFNGRDVTWHVLLDRLGLRQVQTVLNGQIRALRVHLRCGKNDLRLGDQLRLMDWTYW